MGDRISNSVSDSSSESQFFGQKSNLFVGFSPKSLESDSVKSPTSPLDFWVFTNLANPFLRSPKSSLMKWCSPKVGLSIIESLDEIKPSDSPKIVTKTPFVHGSIDTTFNAPKSLPKNSGVFNRTQIIKPSNPQKGSSDIVFGIGENPPFKAESFENFQSCSLDSGRSRLTTNFSINSSFESFGSKTRMSLLGSNPDPVGSTRDFIGSLSASEIELSEDYTCVKTFGPNPKTTHIFGDYVLETHNKNVTFLSDGIEEQKIQFEVPSDDFLSLCFTCKKNLEGKDIYIYRGEKAFCSPECRLQEISMEEREEKASDVSHKIPSKTNSGDNGSLFFIA